MKWTFCRFPRLGTQAIVAARSTGALRRLLESLVKEGRALNGSLAASSQGWVHHGIQAWMIEE